MRARLSRASAPTGTVISRSASRDGTSALCRSRSTMLRGTPVPRNTRFLAAGLPLVSTPILDVVRTYGKAGLVRIAATAADFVLEIEGALRESRVDWIGEQMPGFPCARGTIRRDPWSTIFAALASGSKTRNVLDPNAATPSSTGAVPAGLGSRC
jgi:hypothetical protein